MIPNYQRQPNSELCRLIKEVEALTDEARREVLRRKLQKELEEKHNTILAHVNIVRKNEKRANTLMRRLNIVNNKVVEL